MKYTKHQINYFKDRASKSLDGILKKNVVQFLLDNNIEVKKNIARDKAVHMIFENDVLTEKFMDIYSNHIDVPYYAVANAYCLTYFQVSELDRLGIITPCTYTGDNDLTLYPFSVLSYEDNYLLNEYEKRYKTDFHRTRIEFSSNDDGSVNDFIDKLSSVFDVENLSKLYPMRDKDAYNLYLSIRPKTDAMNNDDILVKQNANLKTNVSLLKAEIEELKRTINNLKGAVVDTEEYKILYARCKDLHRDNTINAQYREQYEFLEKQYSKLQEDYKQLQESPSKGGRPNKLTDADIETMKLYRIQGKSYRELAQLFKCSVGLVSNKLKDFDSCR